MKLGEAMGGMDRKNWQIWHVRLPGEKNLQTLRITDQTELTVELQTIGSNQFEANGRPTRYRLDECEFVEFVKQT